MDTYSILSKVTVCAALPNRSSFKRSNGHIQYFVYLTIYFDRKRLIYRPLESYSMCKIRFLYGRT